MKLRNFANRGMPWEELIERANKRYREIGKAVVQKVPTKMLPIRDGNGKIVSCKVCERSCVDYLGTYNGIPVAIEAKHTSSERISFGEVQDHQADYLDAWRSAGRGVSCVLVSFGLKRFFCVPWPFWQAARSAWIDKPGTKVPVKYNGQEWTSTGMASTSADQLLPAWEVNLGGELILPYLEVLL